MSSVAQTVPQVFRSRPLGRIVSAAVVAGGLLGGAAAQAQQFDFTMAVIPAPGDVYASLTSTVPERFARATGGKVKVTISDSLVPGGQIVSAVRDGRVDMSGALHTYLAA